MAEIAARVGTPCYVYSAATILENFRAYDATFGDQPHTICYAMKANSNLAILRLLAQAGAGFDIVSGGELFRVLKAGGDPAKVVFSGVGKTAAEIDDALTAGIFNFNCESEPELALIDALAHRRGVKARVALRVNPDVETDTHHYISTGKLAHKFGVDIAEAEDIYERARKHENLLLEGVSCHIGSQLLDAEPLMEAVDRVLALIDRLRAKGFDIRHADLGGGLGVAYKPDEVTPSIAEFVTCLKQRVAGREPARGARAGKVDRRGRRRSADQDLVPQEDRRKGIRDRGCRDERSDPPSALQRASRNSAGAPEQQPQNPCRRGGASVRDRRFPGARPRDAGCNARRCPGDFHRRRLRIRAVLHLQRAPPSRRSAGGRRPLARGARARILR